MPPAASAPVPPPPPDRLWDHPDFVRLWVGRVCSSLAFQMLGVAIGWLIYDITGSAVALGLVGLCQFLPILGLSLLVGHVADNFDRRWIIIICLAIAAATLGALAAGLALHGAGLVAIYGAITIIGATRAFEHPTLAALMPGLVPAPLLPRALAVSSSAVQAATIIGPALGGFAYILGPVAAIGGAAGFYGVATVALLGIRHRPARVARAPLTWGSLLVGLTFIRRHPVVLGSISLDLFAVLLGGVTALLPIFARDVLHVGAEGMGALRAAPAVGATLMSLVLARLP